jgi:hypothetical protein
MMVMLIMMGSSVNSYAGKGLFGCCCGGDDGGGGYEEIQKVYVSNYEDFKKYFTAKGDYIMRVPTQCFSLTTKEQLTAGRGQKMFIIEGYNIFFERIGPDHAYHIQTRDETGITLPKGTIIDYEKGIYHSDYRRTFFTRK